jgi:hypothetical protein
MKDDFRGRGFNGCVGAVDCTHFRIVVDTQTRRGGGIEAYNNRKLYTSLSYQIVTDLSLKIRSLFGGCSGSVNDKALWRRSPTFRLRHIRCHIGAPKCEYYMGDGGYNLCRDFMIPFNENECRTGTPVQQTAKRTFNARFSGVRVCVERAFGV